MCLKTPTPSQQQKDYVCAFRIPWVRRSGEAAVTVLDDPMFIRRLGCYGVSSGVSITRDVVIPIWHLPPGPSRPLWSFASAVLVIVSVVLPVMNRKELKTHFPLYLLLSFSSNLPLLLSPIMGKQTRELRLGRLMGNSFPLSASCSDNMCLYCFSSSFLSWSYHFMSVIQLFNSVFLSSSWIGLLVILITEILRKAMCEFFATEVISWQVSHWQFWR